MAMELAYPISSLWGPYAHLWGLPRFLQHGITPGTGNVEGYPICTKEKKGGEMWWVADQEAVLLCLLLLSLQSHIEWAS